MHDLGEQPAGACALRGLRTTGRSRSFHPTASSNSWSRVWKEFNPDAQFLLSQLKKQNHSEIGTIRYVFRQNRLEEIEGTCNSWKIPPM